MFDLQIQSILIIHLVIQLNIIHDKNVLLMFQFFTYFLHSIYLQHSQKIHVQILINYYLQNISYYILVNLYLFFLYIFLIIYSIFLYFYLLIHHLLLRYFLDVVTMLMLLLLLYVNKIYRDFYLHEYQILIQYYHCHQKQSYFHLVII